MRLIQILAALFLAVAVDLLFWYMPNRPVPLDPPPGGKLASVSFAPYRDGQSPLTAVYPTPAQIEEDLVTVSAQAKSIRTYTSREGLEILPELARKRGVTITLGAWLSPDVKKNDGEIEALIKLANAYPDVIKRVIVGNEVLLRRDLKVEQLIGCLDRVRAAVKQPVSYADVWEWWMKFPELHGHVDYVTIHLLPYWEDVPASIDGAITRIDFAYRAIAAKFPGKPILVGETGWPTQGRARGPAVPGVVEAARFTNGLIKLAAKEGFDYNIIEAFDQNWKQALEGTVGGHWGLYTADRAAKFDVAKEAVADMNWRVLAGISVGLTILLFVGTGGFALMPASALFHAGVSTTLATSLVLAGDRVWSWAYYPVDVGLGLVLMILEAVAAFVVAAAIHDTLSGPRLTVEIEPVPPLPFSVQRIGSVTVLILTLAAAIWAGLVVFDGRYRGFPNPHFLVTGLGLPLLILTRAARRPIGGSIGAAAAFTNLFTTSVPRARSPIAFRLLGWVLVILAVLTVVAEGFVPMESILYGQQPFLTALGEVEWIRPNLTALGWAGLLTTTAVPFLASGRSSSYLWRPEVIGR